MVVVCWPGPSPSTSKSRVQIPLATFIEWEGSYKENAARVGLCASESPGFESTIFLNIWRALRSHMSRIKLLIPSSSITRTQTFPSALPRFLAVNVAIFYVLKVLQSLLSSGANLGSLCFFIYLLPLSALDHSATAPPKCWHFKKKKSQWPWHSTYSSCL